MNLVFLIQAAPAKIAAGNQFICQLSDLKFKELVNTNNVQVPSVITDVYNLMSCWSWLGSAADWSPFQVCCGSTRTATIYPGRSGRWHQRFPRPSTPPPPLLASPLTGPRGPLLHPLVRFYCLNSGKSSEMLNLSIALIVAFFIPLILISPSHSAGGKSPLMTVILINQRIHNIG